MDETAVTRYQKDEIILRQGSTEKNLYKVLSGNVGLYAGHGTPDERLAGMLSAPECFGEMTVLAGQPSRYTAVAFSGAAVLRVPEACLEAFIQSDPHSALTIMKAMARRLAPAGRKESAPERLADQYGAVPPAPAARAASPSVPEQKAAEAARPPKPAALSPRAAESPPPPRPPAQNTADGGPGLHTGLFLPGHRGYAQVTHPEYKALVYEKKLACPHCKKSFTGTRIFQSKLAAAQAPGRARYDLRTFYQNFQLEWYDVVTCPHCYFSALGNFFIEPRMLRKDRYSEELAQLRATLTLDFAAERSLEFVFAQHYLALVCAKGFEDCLQISARFWTNICWLYEDVEDEEPRRLAEGKAIEAYKEVYLQCRLNPVQEQRVCMMLAGMLYRAGESAEAREWAFKVRVNRMGKPIYSELAEQLIGDIREELKN